MLQLLAWYLLFKRWQRVFVIDQQLLMSNDDDDESYVSGPCEAAVAQNLMFGQIIFDIASEKRADIYIRL